MMTSDLNCNYDSKAAWGCIMYLPHSYCIVASTNMCYYSENKIFWFLKSQIVTGRNVWNVWRTCTPAFPPPRQLYFLIVRILVSMSKAFPMIHLNQFLYIMQYLSMYIFSRLNEGNLCPVCKHEKVSTLVGNCFWTLQCLS